MINKIKRHALFLLAVLLIGQSAVAQTLIEGRKVSTRSASEQLRQHFTELNMIKLDYQFLANQLQSGVKKYRLKIDELMDREVTIELNDMRAPGYQSVFTSEKGRKIDDSYEPNTYIIYDSEQMELGRLTVDKETFLGAFYKEGKIHFVEPAKRIDPSESNNVMVVYTHSEVAREGVKCFANSVDDFVESVDSGDVKPSGANRAEQCYVMEFASEADFNWFSTYGSNSNGQILTIMNVVDGIYRAQIDLRVIVTFQNVYTSSAADPYSSTSSTATLREEFKNNWNSNFSGIDRDVALIFTSRTGMDAWGRAFINTAGDKTSAYGIMTDLSGSSNPDQMVLTTTHEIGHTLNGLHSHGANCSTNDGGSTNPTVNKATIMCQGTKINYWFSSTARSSMTSRITSNLSKFEVPDNTIIGNAYYPWLGAFTISGHSSVQAKNQITVTNVTVNSSGNLGAYAGNRIVVTPSYGKVRFATGSDVVLSPDWFLGSCNTASALAMFSDQPTSLHDELKTGVTDKIEVYPNPFASEATIKYSLLEATNVDIRVVDLLGKELQVIADKAHHQAGNHEVVINRSGLTGGTYMVLIQAGDNREMKKIVVMD